MRSRLIAPVMAIAAAGLVTPALAGPDYVTPDRSAPLAASDARAEQQPMDDIVYPLDDATLSPTAQEQLSVIVRWLGAHADGRVVVEGHADSSGAASYNAALATRRAVLACNYLIDSGINPDRVVIAVYGENRARPRPDSLDRRVIVFATTAPLSELVSAELDRDAIEVSWTHRGTRLRETRGITPVASVATLPARPRIARR